MSIVPGRDVPEVPQEWVDAVNKAVNDANHEDLCMCDAWPDACKYYKPGQWDLGVDLTIAVGALEPLIRQRDAQEIERLAALSCFCPERPPEAFDPDEECPVHGDPAKALTMRAALAETARWRDAFESLHARLLRDLPGDASELPQPDEKFWADNLDRLLTYASELYRETEGSE